MTATYTPALRTPPGSSSLADILDLILDKGIVIDAYVRVSLVGIELLTVDARIVIASVDTYLRWAEAVHRLVLVSRPRELPDMVEDAASGGLASKAKKVMGDGAKEEEEEADEEEQEETGEEETQTHQPMGESFKEMLNKHGPTVAKYLATGLAAAAATYVGAEGKKSLRPLKKVAKSISGEAKKGLRPLKKVAKSIPGEAKKSLRPLKKVAKSIPGGKKILKTVSELKGESHHSNRDGHATRKRGKRRKRAKKHERG